MSYIRAIPALLVLALFPLVTLALVALIIWGFVEAALHGVRVMLFIVLLIALVGAVAYAIKELRSAPQGRVAGPRVGRPEAPALWALADELADGVGARHVDEIVVTPEVNAFVTQVDGRRILAIGLPLIAQLPEPELRSVLAHEMGHYAGGNFALSSVLWRIGRYLGAVTSNADGMWRWIFTQMYRLYVLAQRFSSRDLERAADGNALRLAGPEATAHAFELIVETDLAWDAFVGAYVDPLFRPDRRADLVTGLHEFSAAHRESIARQAAEALAVEKPDRMSTHPPTRERIERARAGMAPTAAPATIPGRPALALLPQGTDRLQREILGAGPEPALTWDELVARSAPDLVHEDAQRIMHALVGAGTIAHPTAREAILADQGAERLRVPGDDSGTVRIRTVVGADQLYRVGAAAWQNRWTGAFQLVGDDGEEWNLENLGFGGRRDGALALVALLEQRGCPLDAEIEPPRAREEASAERNDDLLGAATCFTSRGITMHDLLIFRGGLLLIRSGTNGFALLAGGARGDRQVQRVVGRLKQDGLAGLATQKGSVWLPQERIQEINVLKSGRLRIRGVDLPREIKLVPSQYTAWLGDGQEALGTLWPDRVTFGRDRSRPAA